MKKQSIKILSVLAILFLGSMFLTSCAPSNKENVLYEDAEEQATVEENEVKHYVEEGNKYLDESNYQEAWKSYEEAIGIMKNNKETYISIKDKYMEKGLYDDAYYVIKLAVDNEVDTENMISLLNEITPNLSEITLNADVYKGENFSLPKETKVNVIGKEISVPIVWSNNNVTTNKVGQYVFEGQVVGYGKKVTLALNVKYREFENKQVLINSIENGSVKVDYIEFFLYPQAAEEAKKDGVYNEDYYWNKYLRNKTKENETISLAKDVKIRMCIHHFDPPIGTTGLILVDSDMETLIRMNQRNNSLMYSITIKDGYIVQIDEIYTE